MSSAPSPTSDIVLYQTEDGRTRLQVRLEFSRHFSRQRVASAKTDLALSGHLSGHFVRVGRGQFLVCQTEDGKLKIDVRFEGGTVWPTQQAGTLLRPSNSQGILDGST